MEVEARKRLREQVHMPEGIRLDLRLSCQNFRKTLEKSIKKGINIDSTSLYLFRCSGIAPLYRYRGNRRS